MGHVSAIWALAYILAFGLALSAATFLLLRDNGAKGFFFALFFAYMSGLMGLRDVTPTTIPESLARWILEFTGYITAAVAMGAGIAFEAERKIRTLPSPRPSVDP